MTADEIKDIKNFIFLSNDNTERKHKQTHDKKKNLGLSVEV